MLKRPSPSDTDDDLLKFQEQFISSKSTPAAKLLHPKGVSGDVVSGTLLPSDKNASSDHDTKIDRDVVHLDKIPLDISATTLESSTKKSRFKRSRVEAPKKHTADEDPEVALDQHDHHITKVLAEIVEREFGANQVYYPSANALGGFPKVLHRGDIKQADSDKGTTKKKSLFAQQFAKCSAVDFGLPEQSRMTHRLSEKSQGKKVVFDRVMERQPTDTGHFVKGTGLNPMKATEEAKQIHLENKARLESMTEEEIQAEQRKLLETLDPDIVSFLKRKPHQTRKGSSGENNKNITGKSKQSQVVTESMDIDSAEPEDKNVHAKQNEDITLKNVPETVLKPPNDWLHMDKLEPEKLEWLKDLPPPSADDKSTGKSARFDFNGNLISTNTDLPVHLGLHHHGDEQERAGYTLGELFYLARSANLQQRALALNTLAKVIRKAREGTFHGCLSAALIPAMVDGGLVFILRWALDDKTDNTMSAAVNALHALLVSQDDEQGLDQTMCWHRGHHTPCLAPVSIKCDDPDEKPSDAELLKQDIIKGLHQMTLLQRLRYILEVWRPSSVVVVHILDILIRICRHSPQMAYEVQKCPRLIDTIFKEFLTWKIPDPWPNPIVDRYGLPCSHALKLIRILCMASKNTAAHIISNYSLMDCLVLYISQGQQRSDLYSTELYKLILESFRTWKVCILYGLGVTHYHECYPMLMDHLKASCQLLPKSTSHHIEVACALMNFLESVVQTAAKNTLSAMSQRQKGEVKVGSEIEHKEEPFIPELNWSHVTGLSEPVMLCLQRLLSEFCGLYFDEKYDLSFVSSCLNFVASWLGRVKSLPQQDMVDILNKIETLSRNYVVPAAKSRAFLSAVAALRKHSVILYPETEKRTEMLTALPELPSLVGESAELCPILKDGSTVNFVLAFSRLCDALSVHKGVILDIYPLVLNSDDLLQYLKQICHVKRSQLISNYFAQFEYRLQQLLINLASHVPNTVDIALYHQVALNLLTWIHEGAETDVHQLLSFVVFNEVFLSDLRKAVDADVAARMDGLKLQTAAPILSATEREVIIDKARLLDDLLKNLVSIRNTYLAAFGGREKVVERSRLRCEGSSQFADTLVLGHVGELVLPVDWVFLPLVEIYNVTCSMSEERVSERSFSAASVATVANCVRYVYCVEAYRPGILESVTYVVRLSRLMCTFLAGSDLFLDPSIQTYLAALLQHYSKPAILDRMDFTKPVPGLASFYDLYVMLLDQFSAVSFGDWLFASYLLLPLQQQHDIVFRRAVWSEFSIVLSSLLMKVTQVMMPVERFLQPEEGDLELLRLYFQALLSQAVTALRSPLPYLIAIHHVNRFMYNQQHKHRKLAKAMMRHALQMPDDALRRHLLYYKHFSKENEHGLELYTELPPNRQKLVNSLL